jgi:hypothetical protein
VGKRGPAPKGEYEGKTAVFSTRIRPDTRRRLIAAAAASGRSLSQELEHRLRGSFIEEDTEREFYGDVETAALLKVLGIVIGSITTVRGRSKGRWVDDPYRFDQAAKAVAGALELFRPAGKIPPSHEAGPRTQGKIAALETIREIQLADPSLPITERSTRQHVLAQLQARLGDLAGRPRPYGLNAQEARERDQIEQDLAPLRRKWSLAQTFANLENRNRSHKPQGPPLTAVEERRFLKLLEQEQEFWKKHAGRQSS